MSTSILWIVIGIVFFIVEVITPGFFALPIGLGAIGAGIAAFFVDSIAVELVVFIVVTVLAFVFLRPLIARISKNSTEKSGNAALLDKEAIVTTAIDNLQNKGRVKVNGQDWKAKSVDDSNIAEGKVVIIKRIEGVTLYVEEKI